MGSIRHRKVHPKPSSVKLHAVRLRFGTNGIPTIPEVDEAKSAWFPCLWFAHHPDALDWTILREESPEVSFGGARTHSEHTQAEPLGEFPGARPLRRWTGRPAAPSNWKHLRSWSTMLWTVKPWWWWWWRAPTVSNAVTRSSSDSHACSQRFRALPHGSIATSARLVKYEAFLVLKSYRNSIEIHTMDADYWWSQENLKPRTIFRNSFTKTRSKSAKNCGNQCCNALFWLWDSLIRRSVHKSGNRNKRLVIFLVLGDCNATPGGEGSRNSQNNLLKTNRRITDKQT